MEAEKHGHTRKVAEPEHTSGLWQTPEHSRFKKGQSGNPKGRPRGTLNLATVLERALREKVVVDKHGKRKTVSRIEAAIDQLTNKAASGELRALQLLAALLRSAEERIEPGKVPDSTLEEIDQKVFLEILNRLSATRKGGPEDANHIA